MGTTTKKKTLTFDDFYYLVKDKEKADLIDGVLYMASPDNTDADELSIWLIRLLGDYVDIRDLGRIFGSRVAFRLDDENGPESDLGFLKKDRLKQVRRGFVLGRPDVAIEIVSAESVERDYIRKRGQYERAGVKEYWIIDEITETVTFLRLDARGKFREVRPKKGILRSQVIEGFWFRPEWFWQKPLPKKNDILNLILAAGAPGADTAE